MSQVFHPSLNTVSRVTIFGAVFIIAFALWAWVEVLRSPYVSQVNVAREQPVPFSHKHHVGGLGLDCRYCHTSVEQSRYAGIPATKTCMTCHSQIWTNAQMLEPVRESYRSNQSIEWVRVHDLPEFAYFNHSVHVAVGMGCESCHGRVDQMPLTWRVNTLDMEWCIKCHRHPEENIRPRADVFAMGYAPAVPQEVLGPQLVAERGVDKGRLTNCSVCHR